MSGAAYGGSLVLTGVAGFVDAIGFILSGGLFVSFMSGNSTQAGVELTRGDTETAVLALSLVAAFVGGVVLGRLLTLRFPGYGVGGRIVTIAFGLGAATGALALVPTAGAPLIGLAAVMGAMNTLFVVDGRARIALTYATGTLVSFGLGVAERMNGSSRSSWLRPLLLWGAISGGAVVGAITWRLCGLWSLVIASVTLVLLGVAQMLRTRSRRVI